MEKFCKLAIIQFQNIDNLKHFTFRRKCNGFYIPELETSQPLLPKRTYIMEASESFKIHNDAPLTYSLQEKQIKPFGLYVEPQCRRKL